MPIHRVTSGDSKCTKCGKHIKTIHLRNNVPYGSECASLILGKSLSAPFWLYHLANDYIIYARTTFVHPTVDDFCVNFWNWVPNLTWSGDKNELAVFNKPVKIDGKRVPVKWQVEINAHLEALHVLYF